MNTAYLALQLEVFLMSNEKVHFTKKIVGRYLFFS